MLEYCIHDIPTIPAIIANNPSPAMFIAIISRHLATPHPLLTLTIHRYPSLSTSRYSLFTRFHLSTSHPPRPSIAIAIATIATPPDIAMFPQDFHVRYSSLFIRYPSYPFATLHIHSLLFATHLLPFICIRYPSLHLPYSSHFAIPDCGSYLNLIPSLRYLFHLWSRPTSLSSLHPPSILHASLVHVEVGHYIALCR